MKNLSNFTKMSDDPISNVYIISIVDPLCAPYWWFFLDGQVRKLLSFVEHSLSFCKSRGYIFKIIYYFQDYYYTLQSMFIFFHHCWPNPQRRFRNKTYKPVQSYTYRISILCRSRLISVSWIKKIILYDIQLAVVEMLCTVRN